MIKNHVAAASVKSARLDYTLHPFGKGNLTTDGVQYSTEVTSIGDTYTAIEAITITTPTGYTLEEIEFGLTNALKSSGATEGVNYKAQASDDGSSWEDISAEQTYAANASSYADKLLAGRKTPSGNWLATGATFQVRVVAKSASAGGETASGKAKNSSYIILKYRSY